MKELDVILDAVNKLPVTYQPVNAWENKKYKPYTVKLVSLDEVLRILSLIETVKLK